MTETEAVSYREVVAVLVIRICFGFRVSNFIFPALRVRRLTLPADQPYARQQTQGTPDQENP